MLTLQRSISMPPAEPFNSAIRAWIQEQGLWWATSITAHALVLSIVMLLAGAYYVAPKASGDSPHFESARLDTTVPDLEHLDLNAQLPVEIESGPDLDLPAIDKPIAPDFGRDQLPPNDPDAPASATLPGPAAGWRFPTNPYAEGGRLVTSGSAGTPGSGRFSGHPSSLNVYRGRLDRIRGGVPGSGGTKVCRGAIGPALRWFANHQAPDGSWSLANYSHHCHDATCTGHGSINSDSGATSLALLPFLAAGQTHKNNGPYRRTIERGLYWLANHQKSDGDLSAGSEQPMYSHGLATIALCEAYGLTHDKNYGQAAQLAVQFIERSQNPQTGGWRYKPLQAGDTSVVGWQVMALKSAQMAGLAVSSQALAGAQRWLKATSSGYGRFSYEPAGGGTPTMSSVGLLCTQYLGAKRSDPVVSGGMAYLLANLPDANRRNTYYWYYATQVMHNLPGPEWDAWNRQMRKILVASQVTKGCAAGSWDPVLPARDAWGDQGGRIMMTSLSCLTLEVYYRYLPLYKLEGAEMGD